MYFISEQQQQPNLTLDSYFITNKTNQTQTQDTAEIDFRVHT